MQATTNTLYEVLQERRNLLKCPTNRFQFNAQEAYLLAGYEVMHDKLEGKYGPLSEKETEDIKSAMNQIEMILK